MQQIGTDMHKWEVRMTWEQVREQLAQGWPTFRAAWPEDRSVEQELSGPVLYTDSGTFPYQPSVEDLSATDWVSTH